MRALVNRLTSDYNQEIIESSAIRFFLENREIDIENIRNRFLRENIEGNFEIIQILCDYNARWEICDLINLFECLVQDEEKEQNGVVFTPKYIADYIIRNTIEEFNIDDKIIDPSCGCGAFLCVLGQRLKDEYNIGIIDLIENNIYGLDISQDHIRRTKLILSIVALINGEDQEEINFNIICTDSLRCNWREIFECDNFRYIIGNPPYVNTHNMTRDVQEYLRNNFETTQTGTYNIFYAFIEKSMQFLSENGKLGFIIPNNFIMIDAAIDLRRYLIENMYLSKLINFNLNLVFNPIKTYNAIIFLDNREKEAFEYSSLQYNENINDELNQAQFNNIEYRNLDPQIWHLMNEQDRENIRIIEEIGDRLNQHIKTGIATLKDKVYKFTPTGEDEIYYNMEFRGQSYRIEKQITRPVIKISTVRNEEDIINCPDRIIFPYEYDENLEKMVIMEEENFIHRYPRAYRYLSEQIDLLNERSSQPTATVWYEYGRSQALNNLGAKLMSPTFSSRPKFMIDEREDSLFVNGYAIFTDGLWDINVLKKILNSSVMEFYIRNTSYSIEGGYLCYQKKYFKNFSIPNLTQEQVQYILEENNQEELNRYIENIYGLNL